MTNSDVYSEFHERLDRIEDLLSRSLHNEPGNSSIIPPNDPVMPYKRSSSTYAINGPKDNHASYLIEFSAKTIASKRVRIKITMADGNAPNIKWEVRPPFDLTEGEEASVEGTYWLYGVNGIIRWDAENKVIRFNGGFGCNDRCGWALKDCPVLDLPPGV